MPQCLSVSHFCSATIWIIYVSRASSEQNMGWATYCMCIDSLLHCEVDMRPSSM